MSADLVLMTMFCPGRPKTKGSMVGRPNGSMHENVAGSSHWRALVARSAKMAQRATHSDLGAWIGPVSVACVFYLPVADAIATRSGDVDKLVRNVLDALTDAQVYKDDVQVVRVVAEKIPATDLLRPGVWVSVKAVQVVRPKADARVAG